MCNGKFSDQPSTVSLGNSLNLVLLLDGITETSVDTINHKNINEATWRLTENQQKETYSITLQIEINFFQESLDVWVISRKSRPQLPVGRTLCSIYKFISQTLCNRLDVPKSRFTSTCSQQINSLIHTPQWRNIHSLTPDHPCRANTCSIFPWPAVVTKVLNSDSRTSCNHEMIMVKGPIKIGNFSFVYLLTTASTITWMGFRSVSK